MCARCVIYKVWVPALSTAVRGRDVCYSNSRSSGLSQGCLRLHSSRRKLPTAIQGRYYLHRKAQKRSPDQLKVSVEASVSCFLILPLQEVSSGEPEILFDSSRAEANRCNQPFEHSCWFMRPRTNETTFGLNGLVETSYCVISLDWWSFDFV